MRDEGKVHNAKIIYRNIHENQLPYDCGQDSTLQL
jgi:hypothetical protein